MLEENSDLSENLEWLLQSGKAGDETLVRALVREQYETVYRLASALVKDPVQASNLARESLAEAVIRAYGYQMTQGIQAWLAKLTTGVHQRHYSPRDFPSLPKDFDCLGNGSEPFTCSPEDLEAIGDQVFRQVAAIRRRKSVSTRILEIALAIFAIGIVLGLLRASNFWEQGPTGGVAFVTNTPRPTPSPTFAYRPAMDSTSEGGDPIFPVNPALALESLTRDSSITEIRNHILNSQQYWHTLWADAYVIDYGPPAYVGPPLVERQQAWIVQPNYSLLLIGNAFGEVTKVLNAYAGEQSIFDFTTDPPLLLSDTSDGLLDPSQEIADLLLPDPDREDFLGGLIVTGEEEIAGRDTLVLEWHIWSSAMDSSGNQISVRIFRGGYWVDTQSGVILRRREFGGDHQDVLLKEISIESIAYDVDIPYRLYDGIESVRRDFSNDAGILVASGETGPVSPIWRPPQRRQPSQRRPRPPNYDPSKDRLFFEWTSLASIEPSRGTIADIFSGVYLGSVEFADPIDGVCARSPDGRLLAYSNRLNAPPYGLEPFRWVDLRDLSQVHQPMPEFLPVDFAFSPDSRRLAVFGCNSVTMGDCGVYLIDTETEQVGLLMEIGYANSLTWSPDEQYLAFGGSIQRGSQRRLLVLNTQTGKVVYDEPFPVDSIFNPLENLPDYLTNWDNKFPRELGGVDSCIEPPVNPADDE